jgi:heme exporter protein C
MVNLANPTTFVELTRRVLPWLAAATTALFAVGLWLAFAAPPDYQQGETVKIMYLHVPAAWMATFIYAVMTAAALGTLVWRHPLADAAQKAAAPLGAGSTFICLVTGSLWGKPMWGTFWVWDARLTSVLVLFILYLGPWSALSTCRSSNSPSTGGTPFISRRRCFGSAGRPSRPNCSPRSW